MNWFIRLLLIMVMVFSFSRPKIFIASTATMDDKQVLEKNIIGQCIKQGKLNGEDAKRIMANELFSSQYNEASDKLQCFLLCYYKKLGIISEAGDHNAEAFATYLQHRFADKKDNLRTALGKCNNIKSQNSCEMVYQFKACVLRNL